MEYNGIGSYDSEIGGDMGPHKVLIGQMPQRGVHSELPSTIFRFVVVTVICDGGRWS